jgi:hypothetical protein
MEKNFGGSNLSENSCAIIGDSNIAVGGNQNLIKTTGTLKMRVRSVLIHRFPIAIPEKT